MPHKRVALTIRTGFYHRPQSIRWSAVAWLMLQVGVFCLSSYQVARAGVTGSISGIVTDKSDAVIAGAEVTAHSLETGIVHVVVTDQKGFYSFLALPVGTYSISVRKNGFKELRHTGIAIDANSAVQADARLLVGGVHEEMTVSSDTVRVETTNTQMGEVIGSTKMESLPLNGRSYTDLLALQPGVAPETSGEYAPLSPSGNLNAGSISVSGQRETANGFMVNGGNVNEGVSQTTSIVPSLDSIEEFRIITNNFNAEYGNYSGGQVNAITKSGTNDFHGEAFDFFRNDVLDARNYFSDIRGAFKQNQFGGTFGGPIVRKKIFFFVDYQGTRQVQGQVAEVPVASAADLTGNLTDVASSITGPVNGSYWAGVLSSELGYPVVGDGSELYYYTAGTTNPNTNVTYNTNCTSNDPATGCVFPNAMIPISLMPAPSQALLKYIPPPNTTIGGQPFFETSAYNDVLRDDKGGLRVDGNSHFGALSVYYFLDDYNQQCPYCDASLPGFGVLNFGRAQMINLSDTKTLSTTAVNEFRVHYMRFASFSGEPEGGVGPSLSSLGFVTGPSTLGIVPLAPQFQGVPNISFNNFAFGVNAYPQAQFNNTYQVLDNYSKVIGTHSFEFGGNFHYDQITQHTFGANNGSFVFDGSETGLDFADFLIGAPVTYQQGQQAPLHSRSRYYGLYAQDSWRVAPALTFNYGLRWDVSTSWWEQHNQLETIIPGEQSQVFPGAPTGWVFPGDPNVPSTLAPTHYNNFAPRVGLAYSPSAGSGPLHGLFGDSGKTSIRAGYGLFYTAIEDLTDALEVGDPPYGLFYTNPSPSLFATPFVDRATGFSEGQRFPVVFPPAGVSASNPDPNVNWSQFEPISSSPGYWYKNRLPYAEHYDLSFERQLGSNSLLNVSYVGTQSHRLLVLVEANPSNPAACLSVSQTSQVTPGGAVCGPFGETGTFTTVSGQNVVPRQPLGANFGSTGLYENIGNASYNAVEVTARHRSRRLEFLMGYTYSKTLDQASGLGDQVNPFNPKLTRELAAFDLRNNLVFSYTYELPFDRLAGRAGKMLGGWKFSGITRFSNGLPVTLLELDDNSLTGTNCAGPNCNGIDEPNYAPGKLNFTNPRSGQPYFNTSLFTSEEIGQLGNSSRRFFHGPGINNWDVALLKEFPVYDRMHIEFRAEFFNAFNHAQFIATSGLGSPSTGTCVTSLPGQPCGGPDSPFGLITTARDPRIGQLALKFIF
jgi:Carboxypeptidase regulatory-like domain/TonB dependent receptor